jgi:phage terminase small subunit
VEVIDSHEVVMKKLTPKQTLFVAAYLANGLNATKAAKSAGYSSKNADTEGARLLVNAKVAAEISKKQQKRFEKLDLTGDMVIAELRKMAFLDPRKLFTSDGSLVPIHELDDDSAASIAGLEVNELFEGDGEQKHAFGLLKKIKIADKYKGLELLGKHLKLFTDVVEVDDKRDFEVQDVKQKLLAKLNCRTAKKPS